MWIFYAFLSSLFAGAVTILAKCGIRKTDSSVATAIRTGVVLVMSFLMVLTVGSLRGLTQIAGRTWLFLILSGMATGASWLCYFRALQLGEVNKVVPVDKSSLLLTMLLAFLLLKEPISWTKAVSMLLIGVGTFLMIEKKKETGTHSTRRGWLFYAILSAVCAALTTILGKIGIQNVESNLGTMIRTAVVLVMAWMMVFVTGKRDRIREARGRELFMICLSGIATGGSWLCYYKALQTGPASVVVPIDKLSILITVGFSVWFLKEKLSAKAGAGLLLLVLGTLGMLV